ncbi:hypothetical protein GCM10011588_62720 [Nocardia jinanensis]|uniref:Uncharacterized protein n=1 Tax=Nocardia jinanensis TaxID=382504 RepID=A0A917RXB2_9NOCA|nr:hypothetical protein GCM10011588_62720 [Nocardia jinanensis]
MRNRRRYQFPRRRDRYRDPRRGVVEHQRDPLGRIPGIHRNEGRAGPGHRPDSRHELDRPPHHQSDMITRAHPAGDEIARDPIGPRVQFPIGDRSLTRDHGHRIVVRYRQHIGQDPRRLRRSPRRGYQTGSFGRRQDIHTAHPDMRIRHDRVEHPVQSGGQFLDRAPVEEIGRVIEAQGDITATGGVLRDGDDEIGLRRLRTRIQDLHREPGEFEARAVHILEGQVDLAQRRVRARQSRLDLVHDPFVGQIAVGETVHIDIADPRQEGGERFLRADLGTQRHRIHEHPDQWCQRLFATAGHRGADRDVVGAREPGEQYGQRGVHHHEGGDVVGPGQSLDPTEYRGRNRSLGAVTAHRPLGRASPVGGQFQHRRFTCQSNCPVAQLACRRRFGVGLRAEQIVVPEAVVAVLHAQRLPVRCLALDPGLVGGREIAGQWPQR